MSPGAAPEKNYILNDGSTLIEKIGQSCHGRLYFLFFTLITPLIPADTWGTQIYLYSPGG